MKFLNKKKIIFAVICALGLAAFFGRSFLLEKYDDWRISRRLNGNPEWLADYEKIKGIIERDKKEPNDVGRLFTLGLAWKSLGEKTRDPFFFAKSLAVYERGAEAFGGKNVLFYWNAGKLAEELGRYEEAENYYRKSIKLADGYAEGYQYLTELYIYKLKKPKDEVLRVFAQGIKALLDPAQLVLARASYLRSIGDYAAALPDYERLSREFPKNQGFREVVKELKQKIAQ